MPVFWLVACVGDASPEAIVLGMAEDDIACPAEDVTVSRCGPRCYEASGCGRIATYLCQESAFSTEDNEDYDCWRTGVGGYD